MVMNMVKITIDINETFLETMDFAIAHDNDLKSREHYIENLITDDIYRRTNSKKLTFNKMKKWTESKLSTQSKTPEM